MADLLVKFTERIRGNDGVYYRAEVYGGIADDGLWEGWVEFENADGEKLRTGRETEQAKRDDLEYWAEGLSQAYLEGALDRAQRLEASKSA